MRTKTLATRDDISTLRDDLGAELAVVREAVISHMNQGLRRMVVVLAALMVGAGAVVVLLARSFS